MTANNMRFRAYSQFVWLWRSLRDWATSQHGETPQGTSPLLIYCATVLMFLLGILEIDVNRDALEALGFARDGVPIPAALLGP
jgi:hypothetical protein